MYNSTQVHTKRLFSPVDFVPPLFWARASRPHAHGKKRDQTLWNSSKDFHFWPIKKWIACNRGTVAAQPHSTTTPSILPLFLWLVLPYHVRPTIDSAVFSAVVIIAAHRPGHFWLLNQIGNFVMCVVLFALFYFVPNILTLPSPQSTLLQFTALHVSGFASLSSSANQHCRRRNHIQATVVIVANAVAAITKFKSKLIVVCFLFSCEFISHHHCFSLWRDRRRRSFDYWRRRHRNKNGIM